jgi:DegV family protein with EDD domain
MKKVKIVTDSTCYLPEEIIKKYDIKIAPLYVRFGDETYAEHVDMQDEEYYERMKKGELADTTQPSTDDFIKLYEPLLEGGYSIISPLMSANMSGTVNAANAAKKALGNPDIYIFDSQFNSLGLGYQVLEIAKKLYEEGMSKEDVIKEMPAMKDKMNIFFVLKDLFYLARLGRIGHAKALVGSIVKIKPILYFHDGFVDTLEQPRTLKKAKARMLELTKEIVDERGLKYISVIWGDNREEAEEYRDLCEKEFGVKIPLTRLGPVIATHTGPKVLSIHFYTER